MLIVSLLLHNFEPIQEKSTYKLKAWNNLAIGQEAKCMGVHNTCNVTNTLFISAKNNILGIVKGGFFPSRERRIWYQDKQNRANMANTTNLGNCLFYNGWIIINVLNLLELTPMYQQGH